MPQTRRSVEAPVRATRSWGSPVRTAPVAKSKKIQKSTASKSDTKDVGKGKPSQSSNDLAKKTEQESGICDTLSSPASKALEDIRSPKTAVITEDDMKLSEETKHEPVLQKKTRKRSAIPAGAESPSIKKKKTGVADEGVDITKTATMSPQQNEMFSPRRSSRAVVPNSRFKDMEMLDTGKKKSDSKLIEKAIREKGNTAVKKVKVPAPRKMAKIKVEQEVMAGDTEQTEPKPEIVTEEIVTDVTPSDPQAQMNYFDNVLTLPNSTEVATASDLQQTMPSDCSTSFISDHPFVSDTPTTCTSLSLLQIETVQVSSMVSSISQDTGEGDGSLTTASQPDRNVEKLFGNSNTSQVVTSESALHNPQSIDENYYYTIDLGNASPNVYRNVEENDESIPLSVKLPRKPQVIVVKSSVLPLKDQKIDKDAHANLIPKLDDIKKSLLKKYWQGSINPASENNIVVVGKDNTQNISKKVIVTPTHTAKNEAVKKAKAKSELKVIEASDKAVGVISRNSTSSALEAENVGPIKTEDSTSSSDDSEFKDNVQIKSDPDGFDSDLPERMDETMMDTASETSKTNSANESYSREISPLDKDAKTVTSIPDYVQPHVVCVKAKPNVEIVESSASTTRLRYDIITSPTKIAEIKEKESLANERVMPKYVNNLCKDTVGFHNAKDVPTDNINSADKYTEIKHSDGIEDKDGLTNKEGIPKYINDLEKDTVSNLKATEVPAENINSGDKSPEFVFSEETSEPNADENCSETANNENIDKISFVFSDDKPEIDKGPEEHVDDDDSFVYNTEKVGFDKETEENDKEVNSFLYSDNKPGSNKGLEENVVKDNSSVYNAEKQEIDKGSEENVAGANVTSVLENGQHGNMVTQGGLPQSFADETAVSKICQVLPVDSLREIPQVSQVQTAIEYVVFGDKMIPIHKPLAKSHGRITTMAGKPPSWRQHGRVEIPGQEINNPADLVKKLSLDNSQAAMGSVLEHVDEKDVSPMVLSALESLQQGATTGITQEQTEGTEMQINQSTDISHIITEDGEQNRVIHGFIDRPSDTIEPTHIVEISQDLFAKEVYGEVITVDPVTGEIIPVSLASSEPMIIDEHVSIVTAESSVEGQQQTTMTDVATEPVEGAIVSENTSHVVTAAVVQSASQNLNESGQTVDQSTHTQSYSEYNEAQSHEVKNQCKQMLNQSEVTLSQPINIQSSLVKNQSASGENKADSETFIAKPIIDEESQTDTGLPADPKVTTHYNKDGSMTIRIEANNSKEENNISQVTVPNIVKVNSKGPQVLKQKRYITIPSLKSLHMTEQPKAPNYKRLTNVKINPAVGVKQMVPVAKDAEKTESESPARLVSVATSTQARTEIETQTEMSDEEEVEEGGMNVDDREHDLIMAAQGNRSPVRRTTRMTMDADGHIQEYVVVSLPEGTEIKHSKGRVPVQRDPVHDEVVTMGEDGMYICMDCDHKTEKKSNWYKHRRKHLGIRPHACDRCNYKAATSSNLKRHMQIHDDVRNFVCSVCSLMFRQKIHLERHIKYKHQEKKVKCPLCDYLCTTENPDLKIHIRRRHMPHEGAGMTAFTCEECGLMTVSKKDLKQHMKFHKKGPELKLFCEFCSFVTDCESRLRRHMLIHTKEKPFQCGLCSYRASQKEHVLRHMRSQHDVEVERKPRKSLLGEEKGTKDKEKCASLDSASEGSLFKDLSDDSQDVDKTFEKSDYSSTDKIFACNHCSMKFSKLINLYKHLYAQHRQVMPDPADSDFQCVVCDFRTNNKKNLLVHMRKHNMQDHSPPSHVYSCVLCQYINPRRRNLFQHMKKKHGIEIVMKEDGSNCYVTSTISSTVILGGQAGETQIKPLSDIITMEAIDDDTQLQIVTEDGNTFHSDKIPIDNIISVEDIANYTSSDQPSPQASIVSSLYQTVAEHEAAEAIQGLQALAQQPGVLETQTIDNDITTEIVTSEILAGEEVMSQEETLIEQVEDSGIQLSSEQINQLSSGDYVEINGEVYKVEIAQEPNAR